TPTLPHDRAVTSLRGTLRLLFKLSHSGLYQQGLDDLFRGFSCLPVHLAELAHQDRYIAILL
ncbi:TPA: hypothetical protein ACPHXH_006306, partial [Pseudomonas aeruginosa]